MKRLLLTLFLCLFLSSNAYALDLSRVKSWSAGEILTAADLNAEFNNILNHDISNNDVSATAGIVASKLNQAVAGAIGATTPNTGAFSTLSSTGGTTIGDATGDAFTINPSAWTLANAVTITGTWTNLGAVTTADINGGTIDGVTIGGTVAPTTTNIGTVAAGVWQGTAITDTYIATITTASKVNTSALTGTTYLPDATVDTTALKTATGEVSVTNNSEGSTTTLPGGEYGFFPQIKMGSTVGGDYRTRFVGLDNGTSISGWTTYTTTISMQDSNNTIYAQQRYVTASGEDMWIFLLIDKTTKEIIGAYQAPDHPAYGNGGDFDKVPHPFGSYDTTKHEIVLVDNDTIEELKAQVTQEKSLLTLINEEYKPNMVKEEVYKPLHSGRFIDKKPELVQIIPDYIKVRKLEKLSQAEKDVKEQKRQQAIQKTEQDKQKKEQDKIKAMDKLEDLGLKMEEIEAILK